jgi:hypothetical protein
MGSAWAASFLVVGRAKFGGLRQVRGGLCESPPHGILWSTACQPVQPTVEVSRPVPQVGPAKGGRM